MRNVVLKVKFKWTNSANFGTNDAIIVAPGYNQRDYTSNRIKLILEEEIKNHAIYDNDFCIDSIEDINVEYDFTTECKPYAFIGGKI